MSATIELLQEGRYRINQESANDGNPTVFEAYDSVRNTTVIVKEIPVRTGRVTTASQQEQMKLAFASQAKVLTEIHHDSLLHVQDFFSEAGHQYLVMESVDGDDLGVLLERNNSSFPVSDVVNWADNLLDALNYLHNFKPPVIHRGVRPDTIKLNSGGKIKLLSFGMAEDGDTHVSTALSADSSDAANISYSPLELIWDGLDAASQKVITNSYDEKAEKVLKQPADARSDIYALGATLYHLLTAVKPVDALERSIDVMEGKADPLRNADNIDASIPAEISDVLVKAMAIRREDRFDTASIMRQVLRTSIIRVKEREAEEVIEQREAAEDLQLAEQSRQAPDFPEVPEFDAAEVKRLEIEAEQRKQTDLLKQQVRQAEEKRLAAEAVQTLADQKAAMAEKAPPQADAEADEHLLEILLPTVSNPAKPVEAAKHVEKPPVVSAKPVEPVAEAVEPAKAPVAEPVVEKTKTPEPRPIVHDEPVAIDEEPDFELPVSRGFGLGMPVIAIGIAAIVIVIVAAFVLMPSSGGTDKPVQTQTIAPAAPAASEPAAQSAMLPTDTETSPAVADPASSQPTTDASTAPVQKVKKPTPTPKPAKAEPNTKKAVTVDDLINDN